VPASNPSAPQPSVTLQFSEVDTDPIVLLAVSKAVELQSAAVFGSVEVVAELCASPRVSMYLDQAIGPTKTTALICAAQAGREDVATVLMDAGAEVDACDKFGRTALMFAAANGEATLIAPLLARGADANLRAENGWTSLMFACALGQHEAVAVLLEAALGEDQTLQATQHTLLSAQSGLGLAHEYEHPSVVALLSHLLAQEGALEVGAARLKAQEARRGARMVMDTAAPLPEKRRKL